eukprot:jgi/Psemu1/193470/e_gw1.143.81.1
MSPPLAYRPSRVLWLLLVPAIGGFLFGYDIGGTSFVVVQLAALPPSESLSLRDAPLKTGWIVSAPSAGALLGTALLVCLERLGPIGRRTELVWAGILYALGGLLQYCAAARVVPSVGSPMALLSIGRWIYGAGIGLAMHGGPTYLAETVPAAVRGVVVGAKEIAIVLGILGGYAGGWAWTQGGDNDNDNDNGWGRVYAFTVPLAVAMVLLSCTIPESARYLESRVLSAVVSDSLGFVWTPKAARDEHRRLMELVPRNRNGIHNEPESAWNDSKPPPASLWDPSIRPALTAGLGLVVLQQVTGQPSVLSYATPILARVPGLNASASVVLALFKVLATSVSVVLVETRGRRTLLIAGCSLMLAALMVLTIAFGGDVGANTNVDWNEASHEQPLDTRGVLAVLGMFAYIAGYQIGFGPITWLMISEIFPQAVRGKAVALAVQTNFLLNALVQLLVPLLIRGIGLSRTFWVFGGLTACSVVFVRRCVPETRGLTLEAIEERFLELAAEGRGEYPDQPNLQLGNQPKPNKEYGSGSGDCTVTNLSIESNRPANEDDERMRLLSTGGAAV